MNEEARKRWELIRARGFGRYVLFRGVLSFGLPFCVVALVMRRPTTSPAVTTLSAVLALVAGAAYGLATWFLREREYRRQLSGPGA